MIEIKNVRKYYFSGGNMGKYALKDVSLTLPRGEIVGLFGENGAGKTTLMKCILGLTAHQGTVTLDGTPIGRENIHRLSFATCEHSFFPRMTAREHRVFYEEHFPAFRHKRFDVLMDFFALPQARTLSHLSTGQKNQFEVILALSQGADYIFMDEPFAGNDLFNREDFYKLLLGMLEEDETVVLSTHLLEETARFIGRVVLLHEGRIVGDCSVLDLEEQGRDLMSYVKETYHYRADRVIHALDELSDEER